MSPLREETAGGWDEYRRLVLAALERLEGDIRNLDGKVDGVKTAVTALQVKAGLIGAGAGLVAGALIGKFIH
jgi:hypothetical protein